ncbi:uncharacterized protein LOC119088810 [Peromyscus leucopus]|uniref:uncharacterized protein LOC119088810 n=1 Tax=Peromyscus leucopus TaxID=10041 RepID=UPI0018855935|nr:uncharacterized protein LOC119088810 [Peromyscus leucopus]
MDIHSTVPNPYTLLSMLPPDKEWYTVLDLKDAFFSLPLTLSSQGYFAFEWHDPDIGVSGQLTWTRLPQGFKNSPTIFDEALHEDLSEYHSQHPQVSLLQYVDDILIATRTKEECHKGTEDLLRTLGTLGYRASAKKGPDLPETGNLPGIHVKRGKRWLSKARKETVLKIPTPRTVRQVRELLGSAGLYRLCIPGYTEIACPLYEATKEQTLTWDSQKQAAFDTIKQKLLEALALGLPDINKPFLLYVDENKGVAKGMLTQNLGPWRRSVAYLSKKLDSVAGRWPLCLRIIAAVALLVKDADKLTLGQSLLVATPHTLELILKQPPDRWVSNARVTHYQALLLNPGRITFQVPTALNLDTMLPDPDLEIPSMTSMTSSPKCIAFDKTSKIHH